MNIPKSKTTNWARLLRLLTAKEIEIMYKLIWAVSQLRMKTSEHKNKVYFQSNIIYNKLTTYKAESELAIARIRSSTPSRERMAFPTRDGPWKTKNLNKAIN